MPQDDFHKQLTRAGTHIPKETKESEKPTPVPETIGPYKIDDLLERGGMSILYLGTHPDTKEPTTLKVLLPRLLSHPDLVERFLNEAEIIAMTDHPNIVKLYGHGQWEGGLYIAMEYIQGVSLRQTLLQNPISLKRALEIVVDIAYALCHLHTHGVIHRDLKPENILITEEGEVKVIDFGIAQLLTEKSPNDLHPKQRLIGTPIYMSPEQRENPEMVSYPSDIYSLGIITYELVFGRLSHGQIHLSLMPKGLQKILNKALQLNPNDRYQDIVDFITDLTAYLNSPNLHKENLIGDQLSEVLEDLRQAHKMLAPSVPKDWQGIQFGLASTGGLNHYGIYYEFVSLSSDSYSIILGEAEGTGAEGVFSTALLKGMIHGLRPLLATPIELAKTINNLLIEDKSGKTFAFNFLTLLPSEKKLKLLSCGHDNIWLYSSQDKELKKLAPEQNALGSNEGLELTEITHPWMANDIILFCSMLPTIPNEEESKETAQSILSQSFKDNISLHPQKIVEAILRKFRISHLPTLQEHTPSLLCIKRLS